MTDSLTLGQLCLTVNGDAIQVFGGADLFDDLFILSSRIPGHPPNLYLDLVILRSGSSYQPNTVFKQNYESSGTLCSKLPHLTRTYKLTKKLYSLLMRRMHLLDGT